MGLESATYIDGLVATNPVGSDDRSTADDHIRLIKAVLKSTFPNADGAYSFTDTEANLLVGLSATSTELNKLDGLTAVTADLELLAGVAAGAELTLGILGVDNITINGNSISSVGDLNLQPDAGNQVVLDGTIQVDAGVVTGATSITSTAFVGDLTGDVTGNADTVTTNANLTGEVTSVGNAASLGSFASAVLRTALTDETGTGAAVFATSPTLVTPALGTPSALVGTNITGTAAGLSIGGNAVTVTTNANLTGHITSVGNAAVLGSFTTAQLLAAVTGETGTGAVVFGTSPTLVDPTVTGTLAPEHLELNSYDEDADSYTVTTGTKILDLSLATYFYPSADMGSSTITFQFDNPAASGRVSSLTIETLGADGATINFPAGMTWEEGFTPDWSAGVDIVSFSTRDNGTTWRGFFGGRNFS